MPSDLWTSLQWVNLDENPNMNRWRIDDVYVTICEFADDWKRSVKLILQPAIHLAQIAVTCVNVFVDDTSLQDNLALNIIYFYYILQI